MRTGNEWCTVDYIDADGNWKWEEIHLGHERTWAATIGKAEHLLRKKLNDPNVTLMRLNGNAR